MRATDDVYSDSENDAIAPLLGSRQEQAGQTPQELAQ